VGLWLKNEDGFVPVSGGGGGGSFDGEHVLTGDPDSPPEGWAVGQLLYDGLEDAAGDAGPHDHDYLPLEGGKLNSGAQIKARGTNATAPAYSFATNPGAGMYLANGEGAGVIGFSGEVWTYDRFVAQGDVVVNRNTLWLEGGKTPSSIYNYDGGDDRTVLRLVAGGDHVSNGAMLSMYGGDDAVDPHTVRFYTNSQKTFELNADQSARLYGNLQVDGTVRATGNSVNDLAISLTGTKSGFYGSDGAVITAVDGNWVMGAWADRVQVRKNLTVDGQINVGGQWAGGRIYNTPTANREFLIVGDATNGGQIQIYGNNDSTRPGKVSITGDLLVNGIGVSRFNVAPDIDTADVLDRAETATMPAPEEAGVDGLTVNEVITALLLKVKELSADIKELKGN